VFSIALNNKFSEEGKKVSICTKESSCVQKYTRTHERKNELHQPLK